MLLLLALFTNAIFFSLKYFQSSISGNLILAILHPVTLSLAAGFMFRHIFDSKYTYFQPQAEAISSRFLTWALILLGSQLSVVELNLISTKVIIFLFLAIFFVSLVTLCLARLARLPIAVSIWILVGNCICGPTAISFAYQFFGGDKKLLAKAIWTNTMIGLFFMLTLPMLGQHLNCDPLQFGLWAGSSLQSTAQVVTSASLFSQDSADISLVIKSVRILLMLPMVFLLYMIYCRIPNVSTNPGKSPVFANTSSIRKFIPSFMIGFIVVFFVFASYDLIRSQFGAFGWMIYGFDFLRNMMGRISSYLLSVSMFGIGFLCSFRLSASDYKLMIVSSASAISLISLTFLMLVMDA